MCIRTNHRVCCTKCGTYAKEAGETKREALAFAKMEGFVRKRVHNGSMWDYCERCRLIEYNT